MATPSKLDVCQAAFVKMYSLLDGSFEDCLSKLGQIKEQLTCETGLVSSDFRHYVLVIIDMTVSKNSSRTAPQVKKINRLISELLKSLFDKSQVTDTNTFIFVYSFLLDELTGGKQSSKIANNDEDYKVLLVQCLCTLMQAVTWNIYKTLYTRRGVVLLGRAFLVLRDIIKYEKYNLLRSASIECLMLVYGINVKFETGDITLRNQIANVLMFFAPGIISALTSVVLGGETQNHQLTALALIAWGKIVALQMEWDSTIDEECSFFGTSEAKNVNGIEPTALHREKWKSFKDITKYMEDNQRTLTWFERSDTELCSFVEHFLKLTYHSHSRVRVELLNASLRIVQSCSKSLPKTIGKLFELAIILAEDDNENVRNLSQAMLSTFYENSNIFQNISDSLEDNFHEVLTGLPRTFNGLDDKEQLSALDLLIGYFKLFGKTHLARILRSLSHLTLLINTLLLVSELEKKHVGLLSEYMIQDLELVADRHAPWKEFHFFASKAVQDKLEYVCACLAMYSVQKTVCSLLTDMFVSNIEKRREVTFVMNCVISGFLENDNNEEDEKILLNIFNVYLDPEYWNLPLQVSHDCMLSQVQSNVVQICLQAEGISKMASHLKLNFRKYLFRSLFPILECAGCGHPLIKAAGTSALLSIASSCGYSDIPTMINANTDYFSYHVINKIRKIDYNENVLDVLSVVIKYSSVDNLSTLSDILNGVLMQSCDKFFQIQNVSAYLRLFHMFIRHIIKCYEIAVKIEPIKSKHQKETEYRHFQVCTDSGIDLEEEKESKKCAEEMYNEDVAKKESCDTKKEELASSEVPFVIRMAVSILERCVHFMPSKNRETKLLVLQILNEGLEIIRDWENLLLPLVYRIWSPLVERFNEKDDLIVINYSFQLFITLARLSKDFIRSRSANAVLPKLCVLIDECSKASHLQDHGSAYRFTQAYKLQTVVLTNLARALVDLDLSDDSIKNAMDVVALYMSNKQPAPLQVAAKEFFINMAKFDKTMVSIFLSGVQIDNTTKNIQAVQEVI